MPETRHRAQAGRLRAAIAQPEALDTDPDMSPTPQTGFAAKKRADHQISAIRPSLLLACKMLWSFWRIAAEARPQT